MYEFVYNLEFYLLLDILVKTENFITVFQVRDFIDERLLVPGLFENADPRLDGAKRG